MQEQRFPFAGNDENIHEDSLNPDSPYIDIAVEVFSMLADTTRVRIVLALREGELPVGELAARVDKTPTSVSQHLAKLRMARMVSTRQEGTRVFYSLQDEHAANLVIQAICQAEHAVEGDHPPHQRPKITH
ncbi:metalloregulator ArsR/SmtB family transcription factor [Corynebacterium sp. TAE3-ERU12]|uniref:ArsR/SmtB family transcription factor n=1 Tax=Corynebacterium sp. TAE3-ERU12 TaxID=2849491 RepID=UPI001C453EAC|nr:metalloregulator ArsR/SmtB family transcription factor [Corynebacterium sp. TAE3-ERU12]MBV7295072.1 metalloregulator ArsR/SmtB family transcription factor [Corynebacterium sp. TAE3-ERU12]